MQKEELLQILKGREVIYAVLSDLFLNIPVADNIDLLSSLMPSLEEMCDDDNSSIKLKNGISALSSFISGYKNAENKESIIDNLTTSYTRLYCLGNGAAVSESVYVSPDHLINQDTEVEKLYKSCNFDMHSQSNEPLDHISYELMFMSYLSKGLGMQYEKSNDQQSLALLKLQHSFLKEHIINWIEDFSNATKRFPESESFYGPLCDIVEGFVIEDDKFLSSIAI